MKSFRCTFGPIMQTDFVWPPPPADLEGCSVVRHSEKPENLEGYTVVRLSEEVDADGNPVSVSEEEVRLHPADATFVEEVSSPAIEIPPPLPFEGDVPTQPITPLSVATGRPLFPLIPDDQAQLYDEPEEEEDDDAHAYFIPPSPEPPAEPERPRGSGFAWAAVFAAISCAAVAYSEFKAGRREARPPIAESVPSPDLPSKLVSRDIVLEQATTPALPSADVPPEPPAVPPPSPAPARAAEPKRRPEAEPEPRVIMRAASVAPSRPTPSPTVRPQTAASAPINAVAAPTPARESAQVTAPATIALATPAASPVPEPMVHTAALDTSAAEMAADEEHIESTLTRFRTAYSRLDARAAREVWPSVDVEALDRAFRGLKSQELRFDRCDLTVDGARARAACRGRAVYVPRVGNQSPKAAAREWTFELRKLDQRWTIASARSS